MTVLVTGGAGYIGSHMVWALLDAGERVVVVDRLSTGFEWAIAPEATFIQADIGDRETMGRIMKAHDIKEIIHFAASISVPESLVDPLYYYQNNTAHSLGLIKTAIENGVKTFVFSSTAAVYGTPNDDAPISEAQPTLPQSPYGMSKLMTEQVLADAAAAHDFRYVALRYFNVSGADPLGRTGQSTKGAMHLIKVATEVATGKREGMDIYGTDYPTRDGTCVRDFVHVTDLVQAHLNALDYMRAGGESVIANCGSGQGYTVNEVLDAVRRISGQDFQIRMAGRRPGDVAISIADSSRARRLFNWTPQHENLDEIVSSALAWETHLLRRNHTAQSETEIKSRRRILNWTPPHDASQAVLNEIMAVEK